MPTTTTKIKTVPVKNLDTGVHIFNIEVYYTTEQNIRGYVAKNLKGGIIGTKFYMDYKTVLEVTAAFRKDIREQNKRRP